MKVHELKSFLETCDPIEDIVVQVGHDGVYTFGNLTKSSESIAWDGMGYRKTVVLASTYTTKEAE